MSIHAEMLPSVKPEIREWDGTPMCPVQLCWQHADTEAEKFARHIWRRWTPRDIEMSTQLDGRKP